MVIILNNSDIKKIDEVEVNNYDKGIWSVVLLLFAPTLLAVATRESLF